MSFYRWSIFLFGFVLLLLSLWSEAIRGDQPVSPWIAFSSERDGNPEIYRMLVDGSRLKNLTQHPANDYWPVWSPDGWWLAFESERNGNGEIYRMRPDSSHLENLTQRLSADDSNPAWSPNGEWIAFVSDRDGNREIYRMRSSGSQPENLTQHPDDAFNGVWSPDGKWIVLSMIAMTTMTYTACTLTVLM